MEPPPPPDAISNAPRPRNVLMGEFQGLSKGDASRALRDAGGDLDRARALVRSRSTPPVNAWLGQLHSEREARRTATPAPAAAPPPPPAGMYRGGLGGAGYTIPKKPKKKRPPPQEDSSQTRELNWYKPDLPLQSRNDLDEKLRRFRQNHPSSDNLLLAGEKSLPPGSRMQRAMKGESLENYLANKGVQRTAGSWRPSSALALRQVLDDGGDDSELVRNEIGEDILRASSRGLKVHPEGSREDVMRHVKELLQASGAGRHINLRGRGNLRLYAIGRLVPAVQGKRNIPQTLSEVMDVLRSRDLPAGWQRPSELDALETAFDNVDLDEDDDDVQEEAPQDDTQPQLKAKSARRDYPAWLKSQKEKWAYLHETHGIHSCSECYAPIGASGEHNCPLLGRLKYCIGRTSLVSGGYGFGFTTGVLYGYGGKRTRGINTPGEALGCNGCRPRYLGQGYKPHDTFTPKNEKAWAQSWRRDGLEPPELVRAELKRHACSICYAPLIGGTHDCPVKGSMQRCIGKTNLESGGYGMTQGTSLECAGCRPKILPYGWKPPYGFKPVDPPAWRKSWDLEGKEPPKPLEKGETLDASSVAPTKKPPLRYISKEGSGFVHIPFHPPELDFIAKVKQLFRDGLLPNVEQGITLAVLLADKLVYCTKTRLTNRFKHENALGGKRYKRKGVIGQVDLAELRRLELAFLKSVSGSGPGQLKDVEPYF